MNFLEIMQAVAKNAGIDTPATTGSNDPDQVKLAQFINEAGAELVRRVDWSALRKIATLTGTGSATEHSLPSDFDRLTVGMNVSYEGSPVRGSLTPDEWVALTPVKGSPRYYYLRGSVMAFYPYLDTGKQARVQYQAKNWVNNGAASSFTVDGDTPMIPNDLIVMGAIWRWRRHVGKDFADHVAEFEAALVDRARADSGTRLP